MSWIDFLALGAAKKRPELGNKASFWSIDTLHLAPPIQVFALSTRSSVQPQERLAIRQSYTLLCVLWTHHLSLHSTASIYCCF